MRGGIELRFGTRDRVRPKWAAVAAILADPQLTSLALYIDVRVPDRPAVGGVPPTDHGRHDSPDPRLYPSLRHPTNRQTLDFGSRVWLCTIPCR